MDDGEDLVEYCPTPHGTNLRSRLLRVGRDGWEGKGREGKGRGEGLSLTVYL